MRISYAFCVDSTHQEPICSYFIFCVVEHVAGESTELPAEYGHIILGLFYRVCYYIP